MRLFASFGAVFVALGILFAASAQTAAPPQPFDAVPVDAASPFGGVSISPTRVVLESGQRAGQVTLYNSGSKAVTYRIETVDLEPLEAGGYREPEDGEDAPAWSAVPILRYAPRQVTLKGGERQVVKILSRARRDTLPGEYRTHLRFSTIPLVEDVDDTAGGAESSDEDRTVSVSVGLEYRITIPLILRVGELTGGTQIASAAREGNAVRVRLNRTGEISDYTALRLLDAEGVEVGRVKGVSVLPPLTAREIEVPISNSGTPVRVVLETVPESGAEAVLLSERKLD